MRVAPAAIAGLGDTERAVELARRQARLTHAHPLGVDGASLQAGVVAVALVTPADEPIASGGLIEVARGWVTEPAMKQQLEMISSLGEGIRPAEVAERVGCGVDARTSVPAALTAALQMGGSLRDTISFAIAIGGDTDTISSMAGAITGAHLGVDAIPDAWVGRLERAERLVDLADRLVDLADRLVDPQD